MSKLGINTGSSANAGDGDSLLSGAIKINSNFNELYTSLGDGSTISAPVTSIIGGTNVSVSSSTGNVTINATASGGGGAGIDIQEEGVALATTATTLNFVGNGVVASGTGTTKTITISGGGGSGGGIDIQDEGVALATTATTLNFVGNGVVASGTGSTKTITISGGGSGVGTENVRTNSLVVSGVSTFVKSSTFSDGMVVTGVVTSTSGINVTGISTFTAGKVFYTNPSGNSPATLQIETGSAGVGNTIRSSRSLDLRTNGSAFSVNIDSTSAILAGGTGASQYVSLYGQGSEKLKTIGTGISVTGNVTCSDIDSTNLDTGTGFLTLGNSSSAFDISFSPSTGTSPAIRYSVTNQISIYNRYNGGADLLEDVRFDTSNTYFKNITPFSDSTYNLGTNTNRWLTSYVDTSYARNVNADAAQVGAGLNLQYQNNTSTILHNNVNGLFNIESVSGINLKPGPSNVLVYDTNDVLRFKTTTEGADLYGNINVGLATNVSGFTSTNTVNTPALTLSHNNPTIAGTSGTTGNIKSIGGAPFYYDGTNWREFVLATGTPVSQPEDTDWDQVIIRNDFDTSLTEQRLGQTVFSGSSGNVDLVTSPVKVGTKSARIGYGGNSNSYALAYPKRSEYNFSGAWTIEGWFYLDTLPTGTASNAVPLVAHTYTAASTWGLNVEQSGGVLYFRWLNNSSSSHSYSNTSGRGTAVSQAFNVSLLNNAWAHIALVRKASNGSIHLYLNGSETTATSSDQVVDNDIPAFVDSYELWFGKCRIDGTTDTWMDGNIDDIRISTSERYTSNFNPPTTALPISGTGSTSYTPPGSKQGEIALGSSPTWTGMSGVTASQVGVGHYRATFSSHFNNSTDYVIITSMNDHIPSTTSVGIGVSRFTTHADFFVNRVSDGVGIDSGSLAINLIKK